MLPPGHAAAGYLVAEGISFIFPHAVPQSNIQTFLAAGFILGALPDIDMFAAFFQTRSMVIQNDKKSHRMYITHTPFFWFCVACMIYAVTQNTAYAFLVFLAPLSHLFLDMMQDEIRPFWPFSKKQYRISKKSPDLSLPPETFFSYWIHFLRWYATQRTWTALCELILIGGLLFQFIPHLH